MHLVGIQIQAIDAVLLLVNHLAFVHLVLIKGVDVIKYILNECPWSVSKGIFRGTKRNRTAVAGFADLCLTTRP